LSSFIPNPSYPYLLLPQQYSWALLSITAEWNFPAFKYYISTLSNEFIFHGTNLSNKSPIPNYPLLFHPKEYTFHSLVTVSEWYPPAAIFQIFSFLDKLSMAGFTIF